MNPLTITWPPPGRYILAVSGGADSMVLLHAFAAAAAVHNYELVVAHFEHGIRPDSAADAEFVRIAAAHYHLPFECHSAKLKGANEATARAARHTWLEQTRQNQAAAAATLTAHHQDDLLETSLLNLARGTGRRGLAPMQDHPTILRPLLDVARTDLRTYAAQHSVIWREDFTNADLTNPRNLLRLRLLAHASPQWRQKYHALIAELAELNSSIDHTLAHILATAHQSNDGYAFVRSEFRTYTSAVACELIAAAARTLKPGIQLDIAVLERAAKLALTGQTGKQCPLRGGLVMEISRFSINLLTKAPV